MPAKDILEARHSDRFVALMKFQAERAENTTTRPLPNCPPATARPSARAGDVGHLPHPAQGNPRRRLLVLDRRTSLTLLRKVWLAGTTWLRAERL